MKVKMSQTNLTFAISVPIGSWHPMLPAALRSLAAQAPSPEVAVLDASGDARVAKALDASGLCFAYRRHGPDAGQSAAIMEGWRNTASDVVGWLNADDLLLSGALNEAGLALEARPSDAGVFAGSVVFDAARTVLGIHGQVGVLTDQIACSNPISQPSCFVRRHSMEAVAGLNEQLHYVMDWEFWARLRQAGETLAPVDAIWSAVYWGEGTKTFGLGPRRAREMFELTRKHAGTLNALKTVLSARLDGLGADWLFRLSKSGRSRTTTGGIRLTAARHPGENGSRKAILRIPNGFDSARSELIVALSSEEVLVSSEQAEAAMIAKGEWRLTFTEQVAPGSDRRIELSAPADSKARFLSAKWRT
ncbi:MULTISPECIES: glycosyltransferase [Hyphobacterium]|uniref:Glycosyltransferase n=1 Tax=Hyphobacterium vulgare TaxID=1736751 RepID=A0ABV6ZVG8_9PROT